MDNPKDTMIEDILEQLIQYGPDDMANIFAIHTGRSISRLFT